MAKVLLFSLNSDDIKVTIEAYFDGQENLVVEGYDIGKKVEEFWGDSDYEYSITIGPEEVTKLYMLFNLREDEKHNKMLEALRLRFNTNSCYSDLRNFLDKNGIRYTGFSWT
jgi:hypothetical protein